MQVKRRLDLEERKLFADTRRVAFVSYLQTRNGFADDIWELYVKSDEFNTGLDSPQIRERADAHLSQLEPPGNLASSVMCFWRRPEQDSSADMCCCRHAGMVCAPTHRCFLTRPWLAPCCWQRFRPRAVRDSTSWPTPGRPD